MLSLDALGFLLKLANEEPQQEAGGEHVNGFINCGMKLGPFIVSMSIFILQFLIIKKVFEENVMQVYNYPTLAQM